MITKKTFIPSLALIGMASCVSHSALASLSNDSVLYFTPAVCGSGYYGFCQQTGGSWFAMDMNGNYSIEGTERISLSVNDGLALGTTQSASGTASGETPNPGIDNPWTFFSQTGLHFSASPINVLSTSGNTASLDFSGWRISWDGYTWDLGGLAWQPLSGTDTGPFSDGVANVVCGVDCGSGDTFTLDYSARVAPGDPAGFGYVPYFLHLEGIVDAVPVPPAVWLFGSGLVGLLGMTRRRKST